MIHINHSSVMLFGNEYELYGLIIVLGIVFIVIANSLLAKQRGMDSSLVFRITTFFMFTTAVFHIFLQNEIPQSVLNWSYLIGTFSLPILFRICGKLFKADENDFTEIGIISSLLYSSCTKLSCTFSGCCYGPPWSGFPALMYGVDTHNPLVGTPLFPLQPLTVFAFFSLTLIAVFLFIKKVPQTFMWVLLLLCIACYYTSIFISPSSDGREFEALCMIILSLISAIALIIYKFHTASRLKGCDTNAKS